MALFDRDYGRNDDDRDYKAVAIIAIVVALLLALAFIGITILYLFYETEDFVVPTIFIYNEDGTDWSDDEDLTVFYNEEFGSEKVAPYSSGSYVFKFENDSDYTLKYKVELGEANEYDIALCYRLKRDGDYVVSSYARTADFTCTDLTIEQNSMHYFELEWYWDGDVNDTNDTLAGITESIYTLTITVSAVIA